MANLKIGFIGCGGIANQKHFPGMAQQKGVDLVAFCDIVAERAQEAAKKYGTADAKVYTDYRELLKDKSLDAVHVLTPNVSHCEITVAALESGKHVLCEKPMAINTEEAKQMLDARDRTGKMLTIGYQYRHFNDHATPSKSSMPGTWATSTMPRPPTSVAAACPPGACSPTSPSRAADRSSTSAPMRWISPSG